MSKYVATTDHLRLLHSHRKEVTDSGVYFRPHGMTTLSNTILTSLHFRKITLILLIFLFLSGCGYHFKPGGENIDKKIQTVFVDNFQNKTSEAYLENIFRTAFIDQFITGGRFKIVDRREIADAVFKGSIVSLSVHPLAYQKSNIAAEERVTVAMDLLFEEQSSRNIIWSYKKFSGSREYRVIDVNSKEMNRKDAFVKLSHETAERAYRLMTSGF
jgi:outer membrane lipopolysaccharide assembly protein LptE/RlpB